MKLKNKQTGEIREIKNILIDGMFSVNSLAELNKDWEDYEVSVKPYWFINDLDGKPMKCDLKNCSKSNFIEWSEYRKQIGNYFETEEEAEKVVEKLKAWKRLKDKGFEIDYWAVAYNNEIRLFGHYNGVGVKDDLDLLFKGKE